MLQHCLLRLWEEAGRAAAPSAAFGNDAGAAAAADDVAPDPAARRLTLKHYRRIGGFADALSRHADEILKDLPAPKLQLAVEQTLRALSELDKAGRAIRRALPFSRLLAETGVDEVELRQALDRFRADDCSFLVPPLFDEPVIEPTTRIDVGHEALLRRWERVSGRGAQTGWLVAEQLDGERYRGLLAIAESDKNTLPPHLVTERWAWWKSRPRTPAWAERYGGGFERVEHLLRVSQWWRGAKRLALAASFVLAVGVAATMSLLWLRADRAIKQAHESYDTALNSTLKSITRMNDYLNDGTITIKGAAALLQDAQDTLQNLDVNAETQDKKTTETGTKLLLTMSDLSDTLNDKDAALSLAKRAKNIAQRLLEKYPDDAESINLIYKSAFRIGDALQQTGTQSFAERQSLASAEYDLALSIASRLASLEPGSLERQQNFAFIVLKLGDIDLSRKNWAAAILRYLEALEIAQENVAKFPNRIELPREVAVAKSRIGQALYVMGYFPGALLEYRTALGILRELSERQPDNNVFWSNQAQTHRRIGVVLGREGSFEAARHSFEAAIEIREKLKNKDQSNPMWQEGLANDHMYLADILAETDWVSAEKSYHTALQIRNQLSFRDPSNINWKQNLAAAHKKLADGLAKQNKATEALAHYQQAGEVFLSQARTQDALASYRSALTVAESIITGDPGNSTLRLKLSSAHDKLGDVLTTMDGARSEAIEHYRKALAIVTDVIAESPSTRGAKQQEQSISAKLMTLGMASETTASGLTQK